MKALVLENVDQFPVLSDVELRSPNKDETVIEVKAAALNRRDYWICKGKYPGIKYPIILGSDLVGDFEGKRVLVNPGLNWGDNEAFQSTRFEVLGLPRNGSLAERVIVPRTNMYAAPSHLSDFEAAALPLAGVTAYRSLFSRAKIRSGENLLISGVGGGVASMALLFGVANGNQTVVTSGNDEKLSKAKELGAKNGVNYRTEEWDRELKKLHGGFDVIVDSAGGDHFYKLVKLLNPGGRIVFYGGTLGEIGNLSPQLIFWRQLSILGSTMGSPSDFENMLEFVGRYKICPVVDEIYQMTQSQQAFDRMSRNDQFGKLVVQIK